MSDFFMIYDQEEAAYVLNSAGIITVVILIVALIALALVLSPKEVRSRTFSTKQLVFSGTAMSLAVITSMFKLFELPMGGSITLFSMFFIVLIGYLYGPKAGIMTGFAYGLLQFVTEPIFYTIPQMIIDYPLAFGALGLSGFFSKKKNGLFIGYIVGITGRFIFAFLSGLLFFAEYTPEGWNSVLYSIAYNGSYIYTEGALTIALLCLPPVTQGILYMKKLAMEKTIASNS